MESTLTILSEFKMNEINKVIVQIFTSTEHIGQILDSYNGNSTFMIHYLVEFIKYLQLYNHESSLIEFLDTAVIGSKSLVNSFIERLQYYQRENTVSLKTSTNKIIHEFYSLMMLTIEKGHSLLDLCYTLKAFYTGGNLNLNTN